MTRALNPPPIKCIATKRDGTRCGMYAKPGTTVCRMHGSQTKQVAAKANERVTLAVLMAGEHRHPWEVVLEATHIADVLMRDARLHLDDGDELTPEQINGLTEAVRFAHNMASTAISTKAHEHMAMAYQLSAEEQGNLMAASLDAALAGLDPLLVDAIWERIRAGLAEQPLPPLPVPAIEPAIPDAEIIDETPSEPSAYADVRTDPRPSADPAQPASATETRDDGQPAADDGAVVPIKRPHNPGAYPRGANPWGHGGSVLDRLLSDR